MQYTNIGMNLELENDEQVYIALVFGLIHIYILEREMCLQD